MKYSLRSLMLVMLAAALILGWVANHPFVEDKVAIEGTWQPTMARRGIQNIGDHILASKRWTIKDGKYSMRSNHTRNRKPLSEVNVMRITLDPSKSPKEIDTVVVDGPEAGRRERGIYQLRGDELKICWGGSTRPTRFEWKEDDLSLYLVTFRRVKESPIESSSEVPVSNPP